MSISSFASQLLETGTAFAERWEQWDCQTAITSELIETLRRAHLLARAEAAFESPELDLNAAIWSFSVLAWGCNVLVDRTEVDTSLPASLVEQEPKGESIAEHWSADLGFRFFYSLILRCHHVGPYDTLLQQLDEIGSRWPLATVGVKTEVNSSKLELIVQDNCLRSILVDRIVDRKDELLAKHPLIAPHVAQAVGTQPDFKSWSVNRR